jgi:hypothetical protein
MQFFVVFFQKLNFNQVFSSPFTKIPYYFCPKLGEGLLPQACEKALEVV